MKEFENQIRKKYGAMIKEIRREKGLTQEQVGGMLGISKPSFSKVEAGKFLSLGMLHRIGEILDFEIEIVRNDKK